MSLVIRKFGSQNFTHETAGFEPYSSSDMVFVFDGNFLKIRSENGRIIFSRDGFRYNTVTVYDVGGPAEPFTSVTALQQRLIDLGHPAYDQGGGVIPGDYVSRIIAGANVTVDPAGGTGTVTVNSTGSGGGANLEKDVNQTAHGFSEGNVVRLDGANYVLAQADDVANANAISFVTEVVDADNFKIQSESYISVSLGLSNGDEAFLSTTVAGGIQTTEPANGEVNVYLGQQTPQGFLISISTGFVVGSTGSGGSELEYQAEINTSTTLTTQEGLNKVYPVNSASDVVITVPQGVYSENDVINFERRGGGSVEFVGANNNVRLRGVRDVENRYFINDKNSIVQLRCLGSDVFVVDGRLTDGYTGEVTTSSYSELNEGQTNVDVQVVGTGFSDNMIVSSSANATLNSFSVSRSTLLTLNLDAVGVESNTVTITYDNGDVFIDTDAITIGAATSGAFYAQDNFTGTTINTGIWTEIDSNNLITQNDRLEFNLPHNSNEDWNTLETSLKTSVNANSTIVTCQSDIIVQNTIRDTAFGAFGLFRTGSEASIYAARVFQTNSASARIGIQILEAGSGVYFFDTGISAASSQTFKIAYDDSITRIYFYHWNGSTWDELDAATIKTYDLMGSGTLDSFYTCNDSTSATSADFAYFDNFYMNNADYATLTP